MYIQELFSTLQFSPPKKSKRRSERNDLLEYFVAKINEGRRGTKYEEMTFAGLTCFLSFKGVKSLQDLYYLKSVCDKEEARGKSWSMIFFGQLKLKK